MSDPPDVSALQKLKLSANNYRFKLILDYISLWATHEFGEPSAIVQDNRILKEQLRMLKREFKPENNSRWQREIIKQYALALPKEKRKKFVILIDKLFSLLIASGVLKAADDKATLIWIKEVLY